MNAKRNHLKNPKLWAPFAGGFLAVTLRILVYVRTSSLKLDDLASNNVLAYIGRIASVPESHRERRGAPLRSAKAHRQPAVHCRLVPRLLRHRRRRLHHLIQRAMEGKTHFSLVDWCESTDRDGNQRCYSCCLSCCRC